MDIVKEECFKTVRLFYVSFYGIIPYVGGAQNGASLMIVYHINLVENTGFLEDLFCKTKGQRALRRGPNRGLAYTQLKIQLLIVVYNFARHNFIKTTRSSFMELVLRYHRI
jgi:hypothetical protein